jgi:hypothetical protein
MHLGHALVHFGYPKGFMAPAEPKINAVASRAVHQQSCSIDDFHTVMGFDVSGDTILCSISNVELFSLLSAFNIRRSSFVIEQSFQNCANFLIQY